jgi:hypothetical protein
VIKKGDRDFTLIPVSRNKKGLSEGNVPRINSYFYFTCVAADAYGKVCKLTGKLYDIKVTPQLEKILTYYMEKAPESRYVFSVIKRQGALLQEKDIQWARKRTTKS